MTTSHLRLALTAALAGVALAANTHVRSVGIDANLSGSTASTDVSQATPAIIARSTTGYQAPVTLYIEDPTGNAFRLVHTDGTGWKYVAGWQASGGRFASLLHKVAFRTPPAAAGATPAPEPLTVFIDGPSGYTFVWTREGAWKFVGKIAAGRS